MNKKRIGETKFGKFLKKNVYYLVMGACIIAIAAMIGVTVYNKYKTNEPVVDVPAGTLVSGSDDVSVTPGKSSAIVFGLPTASGEVIKDYSPATLVWNNTLRDYRVHSGIDFGGKDGDNVFSCYGGIVESVDYDLYNGYSVTVKHSDELSTTYSSLKETSVSVGEQVLKGKVIGTMGTTASYENDLGAHVHMETVLNGVTVDPYNYLTLADK